MIKIQDVLGTALMFAMTGGSFLTAAFVVVSVIIG
jgi:hypothetical protein